VIALCRECAGRFPKKFPEGECSICKGALARLPELAEKAADLIPGDWDSFSLSTTIPREWLLAEEEAFDYSEGEAVKSYVNHILAEKVEGLSGKEYDAQAGSGRLVFDLHSFTANAINEPVFLFGRYRKLVPGLSQSRWHCKSCNGRGCKNCDGKGVLYESVEDIIASPLEREFGGEGSLHASGREDVDVANTAGRPFVLSISSPKRTKAELEKALAEINSSGKVEVDMLKPVKRGAVALVADSHFMKSYLALIEVEGGATEEDLQKISSFSEELSQRTPERVAHRRADLVRKRRAEVVSVSLEGGAIEAEIRAEPGTYIKELVSGDSGRTKPSFSSLLGKGCSCKKLEVSGIEDGFLSLVMGL